MDVATLRLIAATHRDFATALEKVADEAEAPKLEQTTPDVPPLRYVCPVARCGERPRVDRLHHVEDGSFQIGHSVRVLEHDDGAARLEITLRNRDKYEATAHIA